MKTDLEKLIYMLEMQNNFQAKNFGDDWWRADEAQHRAIWIEAGELASWYGYKWWKHEEPNIEQCQVELVDIWHFAMNMFLTSVNVWAHDGDDLHSVEVGLNVRTGIEGVAKEFFETWHGGYAEAEFFDYLETLVIDACASQRINVTCFRALCDGLNLNFDDLFVMYIAKNTLNQFRQNNGYKTGEYIKHWAYRIDLGRLYPAVGDNVMEDNEVMMHLITNEGITEMDKLMHRMNKLYANAA